MRKLLILVLLLGLGLAPGAPAQLIVHDPGNATIAANTSLQSTITAVESVIQSGYMLLDLEPFTDLAFAADFIETLTLLQALVAEGEALMGDAARAQTQIELLFGLEHTPSTLAILSEQVTEAKRLVYEARLYAIRVQTLISTLTSALRHLTNIITLVEALIGNRQGHQAVVHSLAVTNQILATQAAQAAAAQRAVVVNELARTMVVECYATMEASRWADWPSF